MASVKALVNYMARMTETPRYHAVDRSRDILRLDPRRVEITDMRTAAAPPSLAREGFTLVEHRSEVTDFLDDEAVRRRYVPEAERLIREVTGARHAAVVAQPFVRFGERSPLSGSRGNSLPARFIHIDYGDARAEALARQLFPPDGLGRLGRWAHYNVWRVLTPPPQDIPLALCDARSLAPGDLLPAKAVFDLPGQPERTADSLVVHWSPAHRWCYFKDMTPDEALVFTTKESDPARARHVPHVAFDDPSCLPGAEPRASIEIRLVAFFDEE